MGNSTNLGKDSNGDWVPMGATTTSDGRSAGLVAAETLVIKKPQIIPTISTIETGEIQLDMLNTAQIVGVRATVNPPDSTTAARRLANGKPDVVLINDGDTLQVHSTVAITNVSVAAIANVAVVHAAYNAGTKTATGTFATNTAQADYTTVLVEFDFNSLDAVNMVEMTLIAYSDGITDKRLGRFKITGYSL